jgi:hypothetical protein
MGRVAAHRVIATMADKLIFSQFNTGNDFIHLSMYAFAIPFVAAVCVVLA